MEITFDRLCIEYSRLGSRDKLLAQIELFGIERAITINELSDKSVYYWLRLHGEPIQEETGFAIGLEGHGLELGFFMPMDFSAIWFGYDREFVIFDLRIRKATARIGL